MQKYLSEYNSSLVNITFKLSSYFKGIPSEENYSNIRGLKLKRNRGKRKGLIVLDYIPTEDLKAGYILSDQTGSYFSKLIDLGSEYAEAYEENIFYREILVIGFNLVKTAGYSEEYSARAFSESKKRLDNIVKMFAPDLILTFGPSPYRALVPEIKNRNSWLGVPIKRDGMPTVVPSLSLQTLLRGKVKVEYYLGGFAAKHITTFLCGRLPWRIPPLNYESVLIDTIEKFRKFLPIIKEARFVAVDTETENLNRIKNNLLLIQFAKCSKYAYIVPVCHKDSLFLAEELREIKESLREYFEQDNKNKLHIYTNATFDLNVIKNFCGVRYFKNDIWDVQAGEFGIDENLKFLEKLGAKHYSLGNLAIQYGCTAYQTSTFKKKDRSNIKNTDLDDALIEYSSLDVIIPFLIFKKQVLRASKAGYSGYKKIVSKQISDAMHMFAEMQHNGEKIDAEYLFRLKLPDSPIGAVIHGMTQKLLNTSATKKANSILSKRNSIPKSLFGGQQKIFDLSKTAHKQLLFFDVLKLTPLEVGKSGDGKLDKSFQAEYKYVDEVRMFSEITQAEKLRNHYVNGLIKKFSDNPDLQHDHRIRASYGYLKVVTGRSFSKDPNLQQIPSRSELGKNIKRLFIASEGTLFIKVDYRVHEVRGWANISGDKELAKVFQRGMDLRAQYKEHPTDELAELIRKEGDVHILNACYFFGKTIDEMTETLPAAERKELRNAVKAVIFGLIFGMALPTLAASLGKPLEFVETLVAKFYDRFPAGTSWFDKTLRAAKNDYFVESPLGRRRNLWGYLLPDSYEFKSVKGRMERRALNSPIQGMSGDFTLTGGRMLQKMMWHHYKKTGRYPDVRICNSVHDSIELEVGYSDILLVLNLIEKALGPVIEKEMNKRYGINLLSSLEIDIEIGANMKDMFAWDYRESELRKFLEQSLEFQQKTLGYKVCDVDYILNGQGAPAWLLKQRKNLQKVGR